MKFLLLFAMIVLFSAGDCSKKNITPPCIQSRIDDAIRQPSGESPVQIDEYRYNSKLVYLFTAPCCDQYNTVYDEQCNAICAPSGGITGNGDGKCPDFSVTATHVRLVWKKPN